MHSDTKHMLGVFEKCERDALNEIACYQFLRRAIPLLCGLPEVNEVIIRELAYYCRSGRLNEAIVTIRDWIDDRWDWADVPAQLSSLFTGNDVPGRWSISTHVEIHPETVEVGKIDPKWRSSKYRISRKTP